MDIPSCNNCIWIDRTKNPVTQNQCGSPEICFCGNEYEPDSSYSGEIPILTKIRREIEAEKRVK